MPTYIAILRGINVSGSKLLKMSDLKAAMHQMGYEKTETYIQSGNVKFEATATPSALLAKNIREEIKDRFDYEVPVIVLTKEDLQKITSANPFLKNENTELKALYVTFLKEIPTAENLKLLADIKSQDDIFEVVDNIIYLYCPNGYGRTKLTNNLFEKKLGIAATSRNWKTVIKLLEMVS